MVALVERLTYHDVSKGWRPWAGHWFSKLKSSIGQTKLTKWYLDRDFYRHPNAIEVNGILFVVLKWKKLYSNNFLEVVSVPLDNPSKKCKIWNIYWFCVQEKRKCSGLFYQCQKKHTPSQQPASCILSPPLSKGLFMAVTGICCDWVFWLFF